MRAWTLDIPALPPAELSPNARGHYHRRAAAARTYGMVVRAALHAQHSPPLPRFACARLRYTFWLPPSRAQWWDLDNLISAMKPAVDVLVAAGVLPDDGPAHVTRISAGWCCDPARAPGVRLALSVPAASAREAEHERHVP